MYSVRAQDVVERIINVCYYYYYNLSERQHQAMLDNRTFSIISRPSKIMLRVILNRLKTEAEELLAEEEAGFRPVS